MWKKFYSNSGLILLAILAADVWTSSGFSASQVESALSQFGVPSEKEWQFHNLSGTPFWVVKNKVVGGNLTYQEIYILLESKYFKKEILTKLFADLSRKITVVNCVWIEVCSNKETLRQMIITEFLSSRCLDWGVFTDDEKKALGLPIMSSAKKERVFEAHYSALPGKKFFYYTPVTGPETMEEVDIGSKANHSGHDTACSACRAILRIVS
jgi:hypothetical protein